MADYDMEALLSSYGAPMTPANANRAREFFASNPEVATRRAMRLRGGLDDNSDVLGALLDKQIAESMPVINRANIPSLQETQGDKRPAPAPSRTAPTTQQPMAAPSRQGNYGPGPSPSRQGNYGNTVEEFHDPLSGALMPGPNSNPNAVAANTTGQSTLDSIGNLLLSLFGASSVAGRSAMGGARDRGTNAAPTPNAGAVTIPGETATNAKGAQLPIDKRGWPPGTDQFTRQTPEDVQRLRDEVKLENDAMAAKLMQEAEQRAAARRAQETVSAAKRAVGRR